MEAINSGIRCLSWHDYQRRVSNRQSLIPRHKVGHFLLQIFVYFFLDIVYYNTRQYFSILMMVKN